MEGYSHKEVGVVQFSGAKVREIRQARGLTQYEVAKAMDVRPQLIPRWEKGSVPSGPHMVLLLRVLGAELEEVVE